jgi:uncharacterized membrane protein YfcA
MQDLIFNSALIGLTFLLAGMVKGIIGMGLPTVAMGMLGLVMPPAQAASILIIPSLITNLWQLAAGPRFIGVVRRFATMMLGIVLGTFASIGFLTGASGPVASIALGVVLAIYGMIGLASVRFKVAHQSEFWLSPAIGLVTGVLTGATGIFVVPAVPYLGSLGMNKEELIQALGLSFTVSTIALALALGFHGQFHSSAAGTSLLALFPALGGMFIGQRIRERLSPERFRRWFFSALLLLGIYMALRASLAY